MTGDCFQVAAGLVLVFGDPWVLCHGEPVYRGPDADGVKRMAHAWIEGNGRAVDRSNGHDIEMAAGLYHNIGKMYTEDVHRYRPDEAARLMLETGHYGPWHDAGWAAM